MNWNIGDLAVCINSGAISLPGGESDSKTLIKGDTYIVIGCEPWPWEPWAGHPCLQLDGFSYAGFAVERFRKVVTDGAASLIEVMA
jgi:hypothetical protein